MKAFTAISIALGASLASAQVYECDGYRRPDWEDCESLVVDFNMEGNPDTFHENGADDPAPSCKWWYWIDGNCRITHCYEDKNEGTISGGQIHQLYDRIRSRCVPFRAGGVFTGALQFLTVYNDEDQARSLPASARVVEHANGAVEATVSLDEYLEWKNETDAQRMAQVEETILSTRQNEDDVVRIDFVAYGVRNPNAYERGPRLGKGVGYTYEVTESTTFGVTTSLNLGTAWNIFTASAGIEMSQSDTYSVTEGLQFDVQCDNQGQITFWPFYDYYETTWSPSETKGAIWVPVEYGDHKITGEIAVACVG
ncbi:uncharacterized protein F5Z01DRAFT_697579 [Emericellopsis atlantica]|uniref:Uncharacterized protein n=1 Tax=Emericellopsis atlantica TaxID=2614577 RepID=A0A9P8CRI6_9HYPO|nr:uncharacterized protein F5Z01DRAFT_697579 [Emericellopsis atlantica]KAG9256768.1 hypothetical protein F5Z01DRAFT_697579 [Emericellopsis atlantica]